MHLSCDPVGLEDLQAHPLRYTSSEQDTLFKDPSASEECSFLQYFSFKEEANKTS